jgi:ABC-type Zn uptake system ZnuABC Zn-binding protein ZnuA
MMPGPMRACVVLTLVLAAVAAAGCGDAGSGSGSLRVTATTTQVADIVSNVGRGRVRVVRILSPNSDPHEYEPRPSDARAVAEAKLIFRSGGDVDDWLGGLLSDAGSHARTVDLSRSVDTAKGPGGELDPHWWQDASNGALAAEAVRDALVKADPAGRAAYRTNAAAYVRRLRALDRSIAGCIGMLSPAQRKLVTSHDALGYYARRYGLTVIGALIPSLSSQAQPSARDTQRLVGQIERERVRAIFPESSLNPKLERAVSRETGARVGHALYADSLGPAGSSGATYVGSLEANTAALVSGLSGGSRRCRPRG